MPSICIQLTEDEGHDVKCEAQIGIKCKEWKKYEQLENNPNVLISRDKTSSWDRKQKECHVLRWIEKDWISDQSQFRERLDGLYSKMSLDFAVLDARMMIWWEKVMIALFTRIMVGMFGRWMEKTKITLRMCQVWWSELAEWDEFCAIQKLDSAGGEKLTGRWQVIWQLLIQTRHLREDNWLWFKKWIHFFPSKNISRTLCYYLVTA